MGSVSFLHTADLHLSRPFGFLPPKIAEERRRDQRKTLSKICSLAIERGVDLLLVAGDLFDTKDPDPTDIESFTTEVEKMSQAGIRTFVIPGNHDEAGRNSVWTSLQAEGLYVFTEPKWHAEIIEDLGTAITGIAFDRGGHHRRAFDGFPETPDAVNIVLTHASYELFEGQVERYHPFSAQEIEAVSADYVALGHYHSRSTIGGKAACYPGSPEGISFDQAETGSRSVIIGRIEDGSTALEEVEINTRAMKSAEIDCTTYDSETSILSAVRVLCDKNALVEIELTGTPCPEIRRALDNIENRFREACYYLAVDKSALSVPTDISLSDRTIKGRFHAAMAQKIEEASDPEKKRLLKRALQLGLAAFSKD